MQVLKNSSISLLANHQFVSDKIFGREPPNGGPNPNATFLSDIHRTSCEPVSKSDIPLTSSQEIGWFAKDVPSALCTFRLDPRVNHPIRHSELSEYMGTYWKYYPSSKSHARINLGGARTAE